MLNSWYQALFNIMINQSYGPLLKYLPLSLADKAHIEEAQITGRDSSSTSGEGNAGKRSIDTAEGSEKSGRAGSIRSNIDGDGAARHGATEPDIDDFYHPATVEPQRIVWIPADRLGLHKDEERGCIEAGVDASSVNARMDEKGRVEVDGPPPGEDLDL